MLWRLHQSTRSLASSRLSLDKRPDGTSIDSIRSNPTQQPCLDPIQSEASLRPCRTHPLKLPESPRRHLARQQVKKGEEGGTRQARLPQQRVSLPFGCCSAPGHPNPTPPRAVKSVGSFEKPSNQDTDCRIDVCGLPEEQAQSSPRVGSQSKKSLGALASTEVKQQAEAGPPLSGYTLLGFWN